MLFVIDDSIGGQFVRDEGPDQAVVDALTFLAAARRQGKHLVFANRSTLFALSDTQWLGGRDRALYRHILGDLPQLRSYCENLVRYVEVHAESGSLELIDIGDSRRVIRLPVAYFQDFSIVDVPRFLCENLVDTRFYNLLTETVLAWRRLGSVVLRFEAQGGGGQTTADEYKAIRSETRRLCLCIVESDRFAPGVRLGETAAAVREVDLSDPCPRSELLVLEFREAENLIPRRMYEEAVSGDPNRVAAALFLERLENSGHCEARFYLDMKSGLKLGELSHKNPDSPFYKYWFPIVDGMGYRCQATQNCKSPKECITVIVPGFGDSILTHVTQFLERMSAHKRAELVPPEFREHWEGIGVIVASWFCGSQVLSTL